MTKRKQAESDTATVSRVKHILGVTEEELVRQTTRGRQKYIQAVTDGRGKEQLQFVNTQTKVTTPIGSFSTPTIGELQQQVEALVDQEGASEKNNRSTACQFSCRYHVDIGALQASLKTDDHCLIQIAGNFNCLNVSNRRTKPDSGSMVERAHVYKTQGPAATFGTLAAHLYRVHFCMQSPPQNLYAGQTLQHQINLLDQVKDYAGTPVNGKITLTGTEQPIMDIDAVVASVRVGLQTDCKVLYGRSAELLANGPLVDQCHGAAVNFRSLSLDHSPKSAPPVWMAEKRPQIQTLARTVLRAAYEGVYLAAIVRQRKHLYLTLVGGGVFGNAATVIVEELARAHQRYASHAASCLEHVYLCAFSPEDNVEHLLEAQGIKISRKA